VVVFLAVVFLAVVFLVAVAVVFLVVLRLAVVVVVLPLRLVLQRLEPRVAPALEDLVVFNFLPALLQIGDITEDVAAAVVVVLRLVVDFLRLVTGFAITIGSIASRSACFLARICLRNLVANALAPFFLRLARLGGANFLVIFAIIDDKFVIANINNYHNILSA
jgi:hypothetical protein